MTQLGWLLCWFSVQCTHLTFDVFSSSLFFFFPHWHFSSSSSSLLQHSLSDLWPVRCRLARSSALRSVEAIFFGRMPTLPTISVLVVPRKRTELLCVVCLLSASVWLWSGSDDSFEWALWFLPTVCHYCLSTLFVY